MLNKVVTGTLYIESKEGSYINILQNLFYLTQHVVVRCTGYTQINMASL